MKVGHCIHGLGLGGAQRVVKLIAQHGADGFEHYVYAGSGGVLADEVAAAGAVVRIIPRRLPKFDPGWLLRLAAAMRGDRIDVVHTHLFGDTLHGILAARAAGGTPVIVTLHTVAELQTGLQRLGYRWLLPRAASVVACTEAVRRSFMEALVPKHIGIATISNGVEPSPNMLDRRAAREKLGCEPDVLAIGATGRLVEEKGFGDLVAALEEVGRRTRHRVRLFVLGEGPLRRELEVQVHRAGLEGGVTLTGFRPDAQQLLFAFDIIAVSSLDEGLPMVLLEAMAASRCIVATNVGGIGDAIRDGIEGLVVPPRDPAQLAAGLCRTLADPDLRSRLGAAAVQRFRDHFTADRMVADYERLYLRVRGRESVRTHGRHAVERA